MNISQSVMVTIIPCTVFLKEIFLLKFTILLNSIHLKNSGYWDWTVVLALISEGKIISDPSTLILYDNSNWTTNEK